MAILYLMGKMTIRATFALDPETADSIDRLARRWGVSKSEALRLTVAVAATADEADTAAEALAALSELQKRLGLDEKKAAEWVARVRAERRASRY